MKTMAVRLALGLLVAWLSAGTAAAQPWQGRPLAEALAALQAQGLRIVFSSATVTPDLIVAAKPRATNPRQQLDEILAPHGLLAREGPGGTLQILRAPPPDRPSRRVQRGTLEGQVLDETSEESRARESRTYREFVSVTRPAPFRRDPGVPGEVSLDRGHFDRLHGSLADDPLRAVQTLPRVMTLDDLRSDFTVRGSPFRHVGLVLDGVPATWLQHTTIGRGATGSLSMLSGRVLEHATLRAGAYPRRHGVRLGPELELTVREGSRDGVALRGAVGGTHALAIGEGPIRGGAAGSWLVAARHSFLEWPPERSPSPRTAFGFSDALAKVVFDARPTQQLSLTLVGGTARPDGEDVVPPGEPGDGRHRAAMVNLAWRSSFGRRGTLTQRASIVRQRFLNHDATGGDLDRGGNEEMAYRADFGAALASGLLEAGAHVSRTTLDDRRRSAAPRAGTAWTQSAYAHYAWALTPALTVSPGVRVTASSLLARPAVSEWLLGEWALHPGWSLSASAGESRQPPELRYVLGVDGGRQLVPERARYADAGLERRLGRDLRLQATVFVRREHDILREPARHVRLDGGLLRMPGPERVVNALAGTAHGIELLVERRRAQGLSGWAAYSFGRARHVDRERGERFPADFDQRHALTLFGVHRFASGTSAGATFRAGSGLPLAGYLHERDGDLFASETRNTVRLPTYARLDLRADRDLHAFGRRLTLFAEALNALQRRNIGPADGVVDPVTGRATGFTQALLGRRVSVGVVVEF